MNIEKNRLLIVAPYEDEDAFLSTMEHRLNANVGLLNYKTNLAVSRGIWRRHFIIFMMAYKAFHKAADKDYILFGEQFVGLYYALFCRLFFWRKTSAQSMVLQLIYNRKNGVPGIIYNSIYRWLIMTPELNFLTCHASLEKNYYSSEFGSIAGKKIYFIPFGRFAPIIDQAPFKPPQHRYFFSGGTSNRDYVTLIEAFRTIDSKLVIACHRNDIKGIQLPCNVEVFHDVFGTAFQDYISDAYAVILPILSTDVSAGQLVLIDAMRLGKASIVTAGSCMEDYVDASCAISVRHKDIKTLCEAVKSLDVNDDLCRSLGNAARARYKSNFTRQAFADRLCNVMLSEIEPIMRNMDCVVS